MPKMLTDIAIRNLKPHTLRYEVGDLGARCLRVVVQPSGYKSYVVRYTNAAGRRRKLTLPAGITLAAARKLAADALLEVAQGKDPATTKQATKQEMRRAGAARADDTIERWARAFIERHAKKKTRYHSWRQTEHVFDDIVLPAWRGRTIHDIKRKHVRELLEEFAETKPIMANRVRSVLSKFFNWLCERDDDLVSPVIGVKPPAHENVRERALNDDELVRLWKAAEAIGGREGACIKLLILTGQRRSSIACLTFNEVGGDVLELPAERMKGKRAHTVPLSSQARTIIDGMPQLVPQVPRPGDYVFGKIHFHRLKPKLDAYMDGMPHFVVHDIRRSVASGMARIGVAVPVIEKILAHKSGTFRGIVGVYQRHSFLPEMAVALQKWGDHVEQLAGGKPAKVVKLPRRR
jgi:integrase